MTSHRCFTTASVRPCNARAIRSHRPDLAWRSSAAHQTHTFKPPTVVLGVLKSGLPSSALSSSAVHPIDTSTGLSWPNHRSRQALPVRRGSAHEIALHALQPCTLTAFDRASSSSLVHARGGSMIGPTRYLETCAFSAKTQHSRRHRLPPWFCSGNSRAT